MCSDGPLDYSVNVTGNFDKLHHTESSEGMATVVWNNAC